MMGMFLLLDWESWKASPFVLPTLLFYVRLQLTLSLSICIWFLKCVGSPLPSPPFPFQVVSVDLGSLFPTKIQQLFELK